jgi:multidrug efflux pump subunit AcrB
MFVSLHPWADRKGAEHHVQAVIKEIQKRTGDIKEARVLAIAPPAIPGLAKRQVLHLSYNRQQVRMISRSLKPLLRSSWQKSTNVLKSVLPILSLTQKHLLTRLMWIAIRLRN